MTIKETGRLTLTTFNKLYQHYKDNFDIEILLKKSNTTYAKLKEEAQKGEEWL